MNRSPVSEMMERINFYVWVCWPNILFSSLSAVQRRKAWQFFKSDDERWRSEGLNKHCCKVTRKKSIEEVERRQQHH
ncbi:hypothetical protein CEXT_539451 [Caerostris extrusa]|uniref:Uncharacterized protein n=1 Tax=Caerostris extrusa TaxID=172846 RepID=A0AAV4RJY5_CAEEX|nr:hypothetical protein CEXT_539451 [Caerostris extrusa]